MGQCPKVYSFFILKASLTRIVKYKEKCNNCSQDVDFTEQMVLDNLICGLADEAIQTKVFAMNDKDITLSKVVKFMSWKNLPSGVCQILKQLEL